MNFKKIFRLLVCLTLCVCLFTGCLYEDEKLELVTKNFIEAFLVELDYDKASLFCKKDAVDIINSFRESISIFTEEEIELMRAASREKTTYEIDKIDVDGKKAKVEATVEMDKEHKYYFEYEKFDGAWRIVYFSWA